MKLFVEVVCDSNHLFISLIFPLHFILYLSFLSLLVLLSLSGDCFKKTKWRPSVKEEFSLKKINFFISHVLNLSHPHSEFLAPPLLVVVGLGKCVHVEMLSSFVN